MRAASSRAIALVALNEWRGGRKFSDAILLEQLRSSSLDAADRAFTTELFYGVLRNLTLLDFWIGQLRSSHLDHESRDLLRLGLYQLFLIQTPEHAAIYETVELAERRNRGLINGVLRNAARKKSGLHAEANQQDLSVRKSHPEFLIDRWERSFGSQDTEALCEWNNQPASVYARINHLKIPDAEFLSKYSTAERLSGRKNFVRLTSIPENALASGHCYIQDPSTAAACLLLDPRPGDRVLDACAAPGGKTGYLAELMKNNGFILACDRDERRVETLRDNLERLGAKIFRTVRHDWTKQTLSDETAFDRILIDAPCSNTGVMRRRIDVRWRLTPDDFSRMADEQMRIIRAVVPQLKPGGFLVYSTCSLEPEENEKIVERTVTEFSFLRWDDQQSILPFRDHFDGAFAARLVRAA
ncbi:MAG TPA: 16S rRNA (cytosine(967)-C(5))-methyltransferase RsmB [Chthoniobacterales bacterium]|nr:16S rRNA (cytosine(967)-C(5))-methyltransferase RsmB [Chthoniobacterales bacterium]